MVARKNEPHLIRQRQFPFSCSVHQCLEGKEVQPALPILWSLSPMLPAGNVSRWQGGRGVSLLRSRTRFQWQGRWE